MGLDDRDRVIQSWGYLASFEEAETAVFVALPFAVNLYSGENEIGLVSFHAGFDFGCPDAPPDLPPDLILACLEKSIAGRSTWPDARVSPDCSRRKRLPLLSIASARD
jgi:hypothetical protein